MKLISETQLKKKLKKYQIIIFDLDDTIYPQKNYDNPALLSVSKYLSKHILFDKKKIYLNLRKIKPLRRGKKPNKIFDIFMKKFSKIENKKIVKKLVEIFQSYNCLELKNSPSLKKMLSELYLHKDLFLVTNGNYFRQLN
jgi:FMN phosphatase YigB (HAD superfamily)